MGHRQQMTDKQRLEWDIKQYTSRLAANRGHNYKYVTDDEWEKMQSKGWIEDITTTVEDSAISRVSELRASGSHSHIIVGLEKTAQRVKHFTVIYKSKIKQP